MFILKLKNLAREQAQDTPRHTNHSLSSISFGSVCLCLQLSLSNLFLCKWTLFQQPTGKSPTPRCSYTVQKSLRVWRERLQHCSEKQQERISGQTLAHHSGLMTSDSTLRRLPSTHSKNDHSLYFSTTVTGRTALSLDSQPKTQ